LSLYRAELQTIIAIIIEGKVTELFCIANHFSKFLMAECQIIPYRRLKNAIISVIRKTISGIGQAQLL
jgi:hypothetical protein